MNTYAAGTTIAEDLDGNNVGERSDTIKGTGHSARGVRSVTVSVVVLQGDS